LHTRLNGQRNVSATRSPVIIAPARALRGFCALHPLRDLMPWHVRLFFHFKIHSGSNAKRRANRARIFKTLCKYLPAVPPKAPFRQRAGIIAFSVVMVARSTPGLPANACVPRSSITSEVGGKKGINRSSVVQPSVNRLVCAGTAMSSGVFVPALHCVRVLSAWRIIFEGNWRLYAAIAWQGARKGHIRMNGSQYRS